MKIIKIKVKGLSCNSCALKIEDKLNKQTYIEKAVVNYIDQSIKITYTNIDKKELLINVKKIIRSIENNVEVYADEKQIEPTKKINFKLIRLITGIIFILIMFTFDFETEIYLKVITFIIFGYDVIYKALKKIFTKDIFNENFLMSFATISAFAIGEVNEAIGVMLFYQIGEFFQDLAVDNSKKSIENLMDISIETANLYKDNKVTAIDAKDIQINDILLVKAGEKIPIDGVIVEGSTRLDTSSLTGESFPTSVKENDSVLSGVINLNEVIKVKATTTYDDSTVAKIIELVKDSAAHKGETEKFITKFSKIYTPIVLFLAFLLVLIPTLINPDNFNIWFERSLIFLVVSCPCALVASIPLTFFSGLGHASKHGILVKGSNYLQAVTKTSKIVFDKTGTITKGVFTVSEFNTTIDEKDFLNIVYNTEKYSNHPIATSVIEYIKLNYTVEDEDYKVEEIAGKGLRATNNEHQVYLGNIALLNDVDINYPEVTSHGSCIYVVVDKVYVGYITVSDQIKDEAQKAIHKLKSEAIETIMLTGDKDLEATYVANKVGIDKVYSSLLPHNKVEKMNELCETNENITIFVGDGINDAPVLKRSDIGIAMGAIGSDAAIEASDIVIMNDNLNSINNLLSIAKNTVNIAKQNIFLALFIKTIVLILGAAGLASMWLAIFADVGVTLIAILNASRKK